MIQSKKNSLDCAATPWLLTVINKYDNACFTTSILTAVCMGERAINRLPFCKTTIQKLIRNHSGCGHWNWKHWLLDGSVAPYQCRINKSVGPAVGFVYGPAQWRIKTYGEVIFIKSEHWKRDPANSIILRPWALRRTFHSPQRSYGTASYHFLRRIVYYCRNINDLSSW